MKHLLFILFLIPSLCLAQLGINTSEPKATLHVKKSASLPALKLENVKEIGTNESQSYKELIIYEDGTIKNTALSTPPSTPIGNKFYFIDNFTLEKGANKEVTNIRVKNFSNSSATNSDNQIVIPKTGSYAFSFRFIADTSLETDITSYSFGRVLLRISKKDSSGKVTILDESRMDWILAPTGKKMSYSANMQANFNKGDIAQISLINVYHKDDAGGNLIFTGGSQENQYYVTSFIMWRM